MADDIIQVIQDAREDAVSLSQFIYYPASTMVERRLAPSIHTLNYYLDYLKGLSLIYKQEVGTVTVNGEEVKTVRQAINDSIDSVILENYQTQLEGRVFTNEGSISSIQTDIQNLPVVDGKVPVSQVSVAAGVSQEDKNLEFRSDINSQKLDTGITATAKFGGVERELSEKLADDLSIKDLTDDAAVDSSSAVSAANNLNKVISLPAGDYVTDVKPDFNYIGAGELIYQGTPHRPQGTNTSNRYKKRILAKLSDRFSAYNTVLSQYSYGYLYTSGVYLDEVDGVLWTALMPKSNTNRWGWFVLYDMKTMSEIGYFSAGFVYGKTFAVSREGNSKYLYTTGDNNTIEKFDVTSMPVNGTRLTKVATVGEGDFVSRFEDRFATGNAYVTYNTSVGHLSSAIIRDMAFTPTRVIDLPISQTGTATGSSELLPKTQGFALGAGFFVTCMGGLFNDGVDTAGKEYRVSGVRKFNLNGEMTEDGALDPQLFFNKLKGLYPNAVRLEYEGVSVSQSGRIVSTVHTTGDDFIVFEEFSDSEKAIDFTDCSVASALNIKDTLTLKRTTRSNPIRNPATGAAMNNLSEIALMMQDLELYEVRFSVGSIGQTMYEADGTTELASDAVVSIKKVNYPSYRVFISHGNYNRTLQLNISNGVVTQLEKATGFDVETDRTTSNSDPNNNRALFWGWAAPTSGTWKKGDRYFNIVPDAGGYAGWICVTAGTGTAAVWKGFGLIQA